MLKDNLAMLRSINGYSQEQIAERIGISRQAYAKWESGATIPDVDKAARLAQVYGVTLDSLMKTESADGIGVIRAEYFEGKMRELMEIISKEP